MAENEEVREFLKRNLGIGSKIVGGLVGMGTAYYTKYAVAGVMISPVVAGSLDRAGGDLIDRMLGPRQKVRVSTAVTIASVKIAQLAQNGKEIRADGFFDRDADGHCEADEVTEAALLAAMNSAQEKRVPLIGSLIASIATNDKIDNSLAHYLVSMSEVLSFRSYCILKFLVEGRQVAIPQVVEHKDTIVVASLHSVAGDILDMHQKGLVVSTTEDGSWAFVTGVEGIDPRYVQLTEVGKVLATTLQVSDIDENDKDFIQLATQAEQLAGLKERKIPAINGGEY